MRELRAYKNCQILLTAKAISRRVKERYWRLPTMLRYRIGSLKVGPSVREKWTEEAMGEVTG